MQLRNFQKRWFHKLVSLGNHFFCIIILLLKIFSLLLNQNYHTWVLCIPTVPSHKEQPSHPFSACIFYRACIHSSLNPNFLVVLPLGNLFQWYHHSGSACETLAPPVSFLQQESHLNKYIENLTKPTTKLTKLKSHNLQGEKETPNCVKSTSTNNTELKT